VKNTNNFVLIFTWNCIQNRFLIHFSPYLEKYDKNEKTKKTVPSLEPSYKAAKSSQFFTHELFLYDNQKNLSQKCVFWRTFMKISI